MRDLVAVSSHHPGYQTSPNHGYLPKECNRVCTHLFVSTGWGGGVVDRDFPDLISGGYCLCRGILLAIT